VIASMDDWSPPPDPLPPLEGGELHVWAARLDFAGEARVRLEELLSAEERARAERFRRPVDGRHYGAAHGILRALLGRYLGADPAAVTLSPSVRGKPSCRDHPALRFSLSHSGAIAAFAFARDREVGIDIERGDRVADVDAIAGRYFPPQERAELAALPPEDRRRAFLRGWVVREALAKATGAGLARLDLAGIRVRCPAGEPARLEGLGDEARALLAGWTLVELPAFDGSPAAVVVEDGGPRLCRWRWPGVPPS
jgi:4'-phosphopantetheinyl transferase